MAVCPYCGEKIYLEMFFAERNRFFGPKYEFTGQELDNGYDHKVKMWVCPHCDKVLGFSEYKRSRS